MHPYTPFYYELLKSNRESVKKVLELGVGCKKTMRHVPQYQMGASLYMWRDFFPNAKIFGADIFPETIIKTDRIETFLCDQSLKKDLEGLIKKTGSDIDIFIDDGSHVKEHQIFTARTLMPLLKKDVIYIIEDVEYPDIVSGALNEYDCQIPEIPRKYIDDRIIIVRNKQL